MSELAHIRRGSGPPLLAIHGLGGTRAIWEPVLDRLAATREVIAVDLPGFGDSPPLTEGRAPTPGALAAELGEFLARAGLSNGVHLVGNSLGGWVALEMARLGHGLSVTALSPAGLWGRPLGPRPGLQARSVARLGLPLLRPLLATERGRRFALASAVAHPERVPSDAAYALVRSYASSPGFVATNHEMRSAVFEGGDDIRVPVTIAWAQRDRLVAPPRRRPASWRLVVLRDCGHIPTWDDPAQVAEVILEGSRESVAAADAQ